MSDLETLREAARLMRERALAAGCTDCPWVAIGDFVAAEVGRCTCGGGFEHIPHEKHCGTEGPVAQADASVTAHIAGMHPSVALAVADWLDQQASLLDRTCDCNWPAEPFKVARAYLGQQ